MYSLGMPVSAIRTKIRQEFEKHRYVAQIKTVDVLLYKSHAEFQVSLNFATIQTRIRGRQQDNCSLLPELYPCLIQINADISLGNP